MTPRAGTARRKLSMQAAIAVAWMAALLLQLPAWAAPSVQEKTAFSTDQSDLWWNAAESGWGMQIVQQADVLFATLFVYDAAGMPTFYTATLVPVALLAWSGDLYRTTGPYFGAATFDPSGVVGRKVGTMAWSRASADVGLVQYTVDGEAVAKNVQRQLLRYENFTGTYSAIVRMQGSSCPAASDNGDSTLPYTITVTHDRQAMTLRWVGPDGRSCEFGGSYDQQGHLGQLAASYACSTTERGSMAFFELTNGVGTISGRFQGHSDNTGCDRRGAFTGLSAN